MQAALLEHDPSFVAEAEELAALFRGGKIDLATMCGLDKEEVESGYLRGRALLESGLTEQAVKVLLGIAMMRPSEPRYVRLLGFAYHRLNRVRAAYEAFNIVLVLDKNDRIAQIMRAECALTVHGRDTGVAMLQQALIDLPQDPNVVPYEQRARTILRTLQHR